MNESIATVELAGEATAVKAGHTVVQVTAVTQLAQARGPWGELGVDPVSDGGGAWRGRSRDEPGDVCEPALSWAEARVRPSSRRFCQATWAGLNDIPWS